MDVTIPCVCPDRPHETDTVTFREKLGSHAARVITYAVAFIETQDPVLRPPEVLATMSEFYVLLGVESWTLRSGAKALPVTEDNIRSRLLEEPEVSATVVEFADGLYRQEVLVPLLQRAANSSQPSPTEPSTSAMPIGPTPRAKRSKRSSISTIPTADTEKTSPPPDGAYSSSQSLELAG